MSQPQPAEPVRAQRTAPRGALRGTPLSRGAAGIGGHHPEQGCGDPRVLPPGRAGTVPVTVRRQ